MKWMICEGGVSAMKWMISTMKWKFTMYSAICESWSGIIRMAMRLQLAPYDLFQAMMRLYRYIDGLKFSSDYPLDHAIVAIFMMYDEHAMDATVDNFFQVLYHDLTDGKKTAEAECEAYREDTERRMKGAPFFSITHTERRLKGASFFCITPYDVLVFVAKELFADKKEMVEAVLPIAVHVLNLVMMKPIQNLKKIVN